MPGFLSVVSPDSFLPFVSVFLSSVSDLVLILLAFVSHHVSPFPLSRRSTSRQQPAKSTNGCARLRLPRYVFRSQNGL
jgi:hypothetical protein